MSRESNDAFDAFAAHKGYKPGTWNYLRTAEAWHAALASAPAGAGEGASRKVLVTALRELREAGRMVDVAPYGNAEVRRWFRAVENADSALAGEPAVAADEGRDAARYRWLRAEHQRVDPLCHLTWKRNGNRIGGEWVNTADLDAAIDAARAASQDQQQEKHHE